MRCVALFFLLTLTFTLGALTKFYLKINIYAVCVNGWVAGGSVCGYALDTYMRFSVIFLLFMTLRNIAIKVMKKTQNQKQKRKTKIQKRNKKNVWCNQREQDEENPFEAFRNELDDFGDWLGKQLEDLVEHINKEVLGGKRQSNKIKIKKKERETFDTKQYKLIYYVLWCYKKTQFIKSFFLLRHFLIDFNKKK